MERILNLLERFAKIWQQMVDNIKEKPWAVFLLLSMFWGMWGWKNYYGEVEDHKLDNRSYISETKKATDVTISTQKETMEALQRLITTLTEQQQQYQKEQELKKDQSQKK